MTVIKLVNKPVGSPRSSVENPKWTYLPLVDNDSRDNAVYTVSVHTGISSPRLLTSTPYFVIKGQNGMTYKRVLYDGIRQNFRGGTVSNFVLHTPYWLGKLLSFKVWTDGLGEQPDWLLDRIVITDVTANENYVFMCQDWLALSRGNGQLCHTIPAIQPSVEDMSLGFSIVSQKMLYDDHIWLSITKRPGYSIFSRVQRFLCALALLYLAMLTNAMFYPTSQETETDSQSTGLKIGVVELGYREVYVGVVSAILILIPGFLMTWLFMHRKVKGETYDVVTPIPKTKPNWKSTLSTHRVDPDQRSNPLKSKSTAAIFNEAEPVNYSIVLLKKLFLEYERHAELGQFDQDNYGCHIDPTNQVNNPNDQLSQSNGLSSANPSDYFDLCDENPWWFIFIAYFLAITAIIGSATLTIFYSLEWGSKISNQWLMSLFLSTSTSTFVVEPVKILVLALIFSCLFKKFGSSNISTVAPFEKSQTTTAPLCPTLPIAEEPDVDSKEMKKRKGELKLQQRLVGVWKSIGFKVTMVVLVGIVALHADVTKSHDQNTQIEHIIARDYLESSVSTEKDIYTWLTDKFVPRAIPMTLYNGQKMTSYDRKFLSDLDNYRLGPIRIIQYRVKKFVSCEVRGGLHSYLQSIICLGNYDDETAESQDFAANWASCSNTSCRDHFVYTTGAKWGFDQLGSVSTYGQDGYQVLLTSDQQDALDTLSDLKASEWIDLRTRGLLVEVTVFNPSTRLFTQAKVLIETPSFGSTVMKATVESARLYPYITVWDYLVLLFQLIFTVTQIVRLCLLTASCLSPGEGRSLLEFRNLVIFADVMLTLLAFIVYIVMLVITSDLLERVINERDKFSSFDTVFLLDKIFVCCMSLSFFINILMCLSPLSLNYNLYVMRKTVSSATPQLCGFAFILVAFIMAFTTYFTISRGSVTKNLSSFGDSLMTLLTVVLGHGKFKGVGGEKEMAPTSGIDYISFRFMYGFFCFASAIFMINLAISILSAYITEVKDVCNETRGDNQGYDPRLNQFMWSRIEQWIRQILLFKDNKDKQHSYQGSQSTVLPGGSENTNDEYLRKGKFY